MKKALAVLAVMLLVSIVAFNSTESRSSLPIVIATKGFRNQTSSISPITLITPNTSGAYRVSFYSNSSNSAGGYFPEVFLSWTDDYGIWQGQIGGGGGSTASVAWASGNIIVRNLAGQPIQVSTVENPNEQGVYNLIVVVEKIQ
jgi:hypothetical protein